MSTWTVISHGYRLRTKKDLQTHHPHGINLGIPLCGGGLRSLATAGRFLAVLDEREPRRAAFTKPNPFKNYKSPSFKVTFDTTTKPNYLALVDRALGDENIALWPLIHKARDIDVTIVPDAFNESTKRWPERQSYGVSVQQSNRCTWCTSRRGGSSLVITTSRNTYWQKSLTKTPLSTEG